MEGSLENSRSVELLKTNFLITTGTPLLADHYFELYATTGASSSHSINPATIIDVDPEGISSAVALGEARSSESFSLSFDAHQATTLRTHDDRKQAYVNFIFLLVYFLFDTCNLLHGL